MMREKTFMSISIELANGIYLRRCDDLDAILLLSLNKSLDNERISTVRKDRIMENFGDYLLGVKE